MNKIIDLDPLRNGTAGASKRFIAEFAKAGLGLLPINSFHEEPTALIQGNLSNISQYRDLAHQHAEWLEAAAVLTNVRLFGRFKSPRLEPNGLTLIGSALNLTKDTIENPDPAASNASLHFEGAYLIGGRGGTVYGHWLLDFVPQLITVLQVKERYGFEFPIIVANCPRFAQDFIDILGVKDQCIFPNLTDDFSVAQLIVPLITKYGPKYSTKVLSTAYGRLAQNGCAAISQRKLLIGRRKPPIVENFQELCDQLTPLGFEVVFPEDYSLSEQFRLFEAAKIIVGEDGSALHNAGFCKTGGHLIVYSRANKVNYWHASVAESAGLSLTYLQSEVEGQIHKAPIDIILNTLLEL